MGREPLYDILTGVARSIVALQGLRLDIEGQQNVPPAGGAVLAVNHTAYMDFIEAGIVGRNSGRNVRYMMKAELQNNRALGFCMKHCKAIPVDRSAGAQAYGLAVDALRDGELVVIYPEATISRSFELKEFKTGAARMALAADVPIVPVAIWGAHRVWTKGVPKEMGRTHFPVNIRVGEPIRPVGSIDELTASLKSTMQNLLDAAQSGYPMPVGAPWVPARFGGGAPDLVEARRLEEAEIEARRRRA